MSAGSRALGAPASRETAVALLQGMRPRQWTKNALVLLAPASAGALRDPDRLGATAACLAAFCAAASATYLVNDVHDRAHDRRHPRKRRRPVAAGRLGPGTALLAAAGLAGAGLALAFAVRPAVGLVVAAYLAVTLLYSLALKDVPVLELALVASGFVLRALAGGLAARVYVSPWFLGVVTCAALLVAVGKRLGERAGASGGGSRPVLRRYSERGLWGAAVLAALGAVTVYAAWAAGPRVDPADMPWAAISLVPFILGAVRYLRLVRAGAGEAPEVLLGTDRPLLAIAAVWIATFALAASSIT